MWSHWIEQYGYLALFIGTMLEGEAVLILGGYSVAQGYLAPLPAFAIAVVSGGLADALYFWLGRRYGSRLLRGRPRLRTLRARATLFIRRRGHSTAFLTRFAYGLRIVMPIVLGAIRMKPAIFHAYDALGAVTFALLYLSAGYLFGQAIAELLGRLEAREVVVVVGVLAAGLVGWLTRAWWLSRPLSPDDSR